MTPNNILKFQDDWRTTPQKVVEIYWIDSYMGKSAKDFDLSKNISDKIFLGGTRVWVTDFQSMGRLEHDSIREQRGSSPVTIVLEVFPFFKFKLKWPLF